MSLLVVGESLVDLIVSPDGSVTAVEGGGPFNLARAAARLGADVSFASGIADDAFGRRIRQLLEVDGVHLPVAPHPDLLTTLAIAELDVSGSATYRFYTDGTAAPQMHREEIPLQPVPHALAVGTLGLVLDPMASNVEAAVLAADEETLVFIDPNCRPAVTHDAAAFRDRIWRLVQRADVVKVSTDDLAFLLPGIAPDEAARSVVQRGAAVVLVTDGGNPVRIVSRNFDATVPVPRVDIVDTVGAGDAFGGAFLAFWIGAGHRRNELASAELVRAGVERAVAVSAITCQRPGANPPHLNEL